MNRKITIVAVLVVAGTAFFLAGCKKPPVVEDKGKVPEPQVNIPASTGMPSELAPSAAPAVPRAVLDEEVNTRWKAVEITVVEKKEGGQEFKIEIPLRGEMAIEGTPLTIKMLGFVPDFSMGTDTIATKSLDDANPAVKIVVAEGEKELFNGWSFRDYPDMHPFEDPRFSIFMTRAIPVE